MGLFSSKPKASKAKGKGKSKITDHDRAMLDLKNARDRLRRYQKKLQADMERMQAQALQLVREGRKDRAIVILKIKKYKLAQLEMADKQLYTVSELIETIEWETQQLKVFDALKAGNAALDKIQKEMPIEAVEALMADTEEALAYEQEVSRAIAGSWAAGEDDEELEAEFALLQQEMADETAAAAEPAPAAAAAAAAAAAVRPVPAKEPMPVAAEQVQPAVAAAAAAPQSLPASATVPAAPAAAPAVAAPAAAAAAVANKVPEEVARDAMAAAREADASALAAAQELVSQLPQAPTHVPVVALSPQQPSAGSTEGAEAARPARQLVAA